MQVTSLLRRLRSPSVIYLLANALTRLGAFALIPLYVRRLDETAYGDYVLAQTVLALAPALALGMPMAIARFYFDAEDLTVARRRFGSVARWTMVLSAGVAALCALAVFFVPAGTGLVSRRAMWLLDVAVLGNVVYGIPSQHTRNAQQPVIAVAFQLSEFVLLVGTGILFVAGLGRGFTGAVESLAVTYAVLGLVGAVYILRAVDGSLSPALLRESLRLALPYVPHFLAQWVQSAADRWSLKLAGQDASVGTYGLASQLSMPPQMVVSAWYLERAAVMGEGFRSGGLRRLGEMLPRARHTFLLMAVVPSVLVVLGIPVLRLIVPREGVFLYLPALLLVGVVDALYYPHQLVLYYAGRSRLLAGATVASAVATIAAVWIFVPPFGMWGAVMARLVSTATKTGIVWVASLRPGDEPTPEPAKPAPP